MPVALDPDVWDSWLDRELTDTETALGLIRTIDPDEIMEHAVSKRVNTVKNNDPDLRAPAEPDTLF
jgi:putative SOS response-associated peptidase YedK